MYEVPDGYYRRLHHIRPRFKGDLENVLFFMANEIAKLSPQEKEGFDKELNDAIRLFPGNQTKTDKTINNWRTEISSLFGFVVYESKQNKVIGRPSRIAINLSNKQDLVEFFRFFLYTFQYPGGHLKPHECKELVADRIEFKPAPYIISLLSAAEEEIGSRFGLNKAEATHCIFNDLRVTRDRRPVQEVIQLIEENRQKNVRYDRVGDVTRYAGDILDYMFVADLLVKHGKTYYLNKDVFEIIQHFIRDGVWFNGYESLSGVKDVEKYGEVEEGWFRFLEKNVDAVAFEADLLGMLEADKKSYFQLTKPERLEGTPLEGLKAKIEGKKIGTKEEGKYGEAIIQGHECMKLKNANMHDLIDKVITIPDQRGLGYDLRSFDERGEKLKKIEVKTTISGSEIDFNNFTLTPNEWNVAECEGENYYVYRLMVSRQGVRLFVIRDPVGKYKQGRLDMRASSGGGMQISFGADAGEPEELLIWED